MKKITKLFAIFGSATALTSIAPVLLTSCKNGSSETTNSIKISTKDNVILGSNTTTTLVFSLDKALSEGEKLTYTAPATDKFAFGELKVENTIATIVVTKKDTCADNDYWAGTIKFECKKGNTLVWSASVADCAIYYSSVVAWNKTSRQVTTTEDADQFTMEFDLADSIQKGHSLFIKPVVNTKKTTANTNVVLNSFTTTNKKLTLSLEMQNTDTVTRQCEVWADDYSEFDLEIYCVDENNAPVWHTTQKKFVVTKITKAIAFTTDQLEIDGTTLKGWKSGAAYTNNANTINLTLDGFTAITSIAENFFASFPDGAKAGLKQIIFNSNCNTIGANAFKGSNLTYLDFTQMPDDATWFKQGSFGTNSFANITPTGGKGNIYFNESWSTYKTHHMKQALYQAGLYDLSWYDATKVSTIAELREALEVGGFIQLTQDIHITDGLHTVVKGNSIIDFAGNTIYVDKLISYSSEDPEGNYNNSVFGVWNGAQLVIEDTGTTQGGIQVTDKLITTASEEEETEYVQRKHDTYCFSVKSNNTYRDNPTLTICGGKFTANRTCAYSYNAKVYIEGGEFHLNPKSVEFWYNQTIQSSKNGVAYMLNCHDTEYKAGTANFIVSDGKFYDGEGETETLIGQQFDPSNSLSDSTKEGKNANFLADPDHYEVKHNNDKGYNYITLKE